MSHKPTTVFDQYKDYVELVPGVFIDNQDPNNTAVHIVDRNGEIAMWNSDEVAEDPEAFIAAVTAVITSPPSIILLHTGSLRLQTGHLYFVPSGFSLMPMTNSLHKSCLITILQVLAAYGADKVRLNLENKGQCFDPPVFISVEDMISMMVSGITNDVKFEITTDTKKQASS